MKWKSQSLFYNAAEKSIITIKFDVDNNTDSHAAFLLCSAEGHTTVDRSLWLRKDFTTYFTQRCSRG